ncbi:protease [Bdellovibrio bacteriovorus]|uniref:Protease n=1 Tax=Bdellovibrio bacteriovorus TaxID=959 RepID=A0A1Z3N600_BDEBC|nr:protease [Bdellovibrio bacteriovorus]ASD62899.1 protease [Bdellovibrio bacteriovorus]
MKLKALLAGVLLATTMQATANEFDDGTGEFDPRPLPQYSEAELQKKIENEMAIACSGNLCKIVGQDSSGSGWTVQFQVGYGRANGGDGDTIYIGDYDNGNNNSNGYANITVTYKNYKCRSNLLVTPAVYRFVNTYLYNMVNSDGSVKRNFSPADQTVVLFYTTMLNKVSSCGSGLN